MYLLPVRGQRGSDIKSAIQLLREAYQVLKSGLAPLNLGFIYQTATPVHEADQETLGLIPWE